MVGILFLCLYRSDILSLSFCYISNIFSHISIVTLSSQFPEIFSAVQVGSLYQACTNNRRRKVVTLLALLESWNQYGLWLAWSQQSACELSIVHGMKPFQLAIFYTRK
jgi:hypothetical protein